MPSPGTPGEAVAPAPPSSVGHHRLPASNFVRKEVIPPELPTGLQTPRFPWGGEAARSPCLTERTCWPGVEETQ